MALNELKQLGRASQLRAWVCGTCNQLLLLLALTQARVYSTEYRTWKVKSSIGPFLTSLLIGWYYRVSWKKEIIFVLFCMKLARSEFSVGNTTREGVQNTHHWSGRNDTATENWVDQLSCITLWQSIHSLVASGSVIRGLYAFSGTIHHTL